MEKANIDTIAMTRRIRDKMYEEMRGMAVEEQIAYIRKRARLASKPTQTQQRKPAKRSSTGRRRLEHTRAAAKLEPTTSPRSR